MKKAQKILGTACIAVGLLIIGLQMPDLINGEQNGLQMVAAGMINIIMGFFFFANSKKKKKCVKQIKASTAKASKAVIVIGFLILAIVIIAAIITENYTNAITLAIMGFLILASGFLLKQSKTQCN